VIIDDLLHHLQHVIRLVGVIWHHVSDDDDDDYDDDVDYNVNGDDNYDDKLCR
jgi:hypothetical protein